MVWNATHIFWQQQLLILSILLPPIFIAVMAVGLAAPRLFTAKQATEHKKQPAEALQASRQPVHSSR